MIRFCDKEVCCVAYETLNRQEILSYFFQDHMDEIVCVYENNKYLGFITYYSLIGSSDFNKVICKECVVLSKDMWKQGRAYFEKCSYLWGELGWLPVVNQSGELVCFAYEDATANKEIRMLREMLQHKDWLGFRDVYPEYDCVTLYGCNELAFFFYEYLMENEIAVKVSGGLWGALEIDSDQSENLDYREMIIHCEGRGQRDEDVYKRVLRSVSVEFECIDRIYEENIKAGNISDADGDFEAFMEKIRGKKIILCGEEYDVLNTYDFFSRGG